jgi:hypothetical protein
VQIFQIFQQIQNQRRNERFFDTTPNKNLGGEGAQTDKKVPLQVIILEDEILLWCLYSYLVHALNECKLPRWAGLYTIWQGPETLLRGRGSCEFTAN